MRLSSTMKLIYKIASVSLWRKAQDKGRFDGAPVDATAAKYFSGKDDLLLIAVDAKRLGDGLRFEPSRGGFIHIFIPLCRSMPWSGQNLCCSGWTGGMISRAF